MPDQNVLFDQTFETPKGTLRLAVDFSRVVQDMDNYTSKLLMARRIPFDTQNVSPADPLVIQASQLMPWIEDGGEIIDMVRRHYDLYTARARNDASMLAITRVNPTLEFDPMPYPVEADADEWDVGLPEPVRNLNHPLERRLKQILDLITSDAVVAARFYNAVQTIFVEAERRSRKVDDDGFRTRRPNRNPVKKARPGSVQPQATNDDPALGGLPRRDGDLEPQVGGSAPSEVS